MKKAIILFLVPVLILTLMLSGCGKSTAAQESSPAASAQPPSVNVTVELPDGSGTEADPYRISTAAQLEGIAQLLNTKESYEDYSSAFYLLTADIDLGGADLSPIGTYSSGFRGVFDGGGYTVQNFRIHGGQEDNKLGLFAQVNEGTVKNLTVSNAEIQALSESAEIAAVIAHAFHPTVENCHTTASVTVRGGYKAAGVCAWYSGGNPIRDCSNAASVSVSGPVSTAAGISAYISAPVINCSNSGTIVSEQEDAAGIAVQASAGLSGCVNTGDVSAADDAAGIVCSFSDGALNSSMNNASVTLENCSNSGNITATEHYAGGIAASCSTGIVKDCANSGNVTAPDTVGGIFGYFQPGLFGTPAEKFTVSGCRNSGTVTCAAIYGNGDSGGIAGSVDGGSTTEFLFENCENSGSVLSSGMTGVADSNGPAGGIIGFGTAKGISLTNCINTGSVRGAHYAGGMIGQIYPNDIKNTTGSYLRLDKCSNRGSIYAVDAEGYTVEIFAGGMIAYSGKYIQEQKQIISFELQEFNNCVNTGKLSGDTGRVPLCTDELCASLKSALA